GKVTFNGKPLPAGRIFFLPNAAKGNSGRGGFADIKDGAYDTRHKGGPTPGGALIVRIDGFDGKTTPDNPVGQAQFLGYEVQVEVGPPPAQDVACLPNYTLNASALYGLSSLRLARSRSSSASKRR